MSCSKMNVVNFPHKTDASIASNHPVDAPLASRDKPAVSTNANVKSDPPRALGLKDDATNASNVAHELYSVTSGNHVVLPGTFKSIIHPNVTGDISVTIQDITSLHDAIRAQKTQIDTSTSCDARVHGVELKSQELKASVKLIYRNHHTPPSSPAHSDSIATNANTSTLKNAVFDCKGKICVSTTTRDAGSVESEHGRNSPATPKGSPPAQLPSAAQNLIKQYEMMFVQSDFDPGQCFFSVTFSKTLVQYQQQPHDDSESHGFGHFDKGLMLSGHYTCLRGYDIGTVRVHLSNAVLSSREETVVGPLAANQNVSSAANEIPASVFELQEAAVRLNATAPPLSLFHAASTPFVPSSLSIDATHYRRSSYPQHDHPPQSNDDYQNGGDTHFGTPHHGNFSKNHPSASFHPQFDSSTRDHSKTGSPSNNHSADAPLYYPSRAQVRYCYGCGDADHLHKDCPKDQLFCYNCNHTGHSSKNCRQPKPWETSANFMPDMGDSFHATVPPERSNLSRVPLTPSHSNVRSRAPTSSEQLSSPPTSNMTTSTSAPLDLIFSAFCFYVEK